MRDVPAGAQYYNHNLGRYYRFENGELQYSMRLSPEHTIWNVSAKTRWNTERILNWIEERLEVV